MKVFTLRSTTAVVVANMIGTGVFTSLGFQLAGLRSIYTIVLLWTIGGLSSLCGALVYAELSKNIPRSGGEYHFLGKIYHPVLGFSAGFVSLFFGFAAPLALMCMALGNYLQHIIPISSLIIALGALLFIATMHLVSLKFSAKFQVITTSMKVLLILSFIIAGFFALDGNVVDANLREGNFTTEALSMPFAVGLAYVFFSYSGWNAATYFTDEVKNARKNVGLALIIGVLIVATLYILINVVFMLSAPLNEISGQLEVGHVTAKYIFGERGGALMSLLISLALVSSISSLIVAGPRVAKVMGEDYSLFGALAKENKRGTPAVAILLQVAIATIFILTASFENVLVYTGFVLNLFNLITIFGLFVAEKKELFKSSWKTKVFASIFLFIYGWATLYLFGARPKESILGVITVLLGMVLYYFVHKKKVVV